MGGALANNLLKAKGNEVGKSLVDENSYDFYEILKNKKLVLPDDVVVESESKLLNKNIDEVEKHDVIVDIGRESTAFLVEFVKKSKFVVWNGPLGKSELGDNSATSTVLKSFSKSKQESVLGGGDLVSFVKDEKDFSFVSTGGGAMLEFLVNGTLPGIKALE